MKGVWCDGRAQGICCVEGYKAGGLISCDWQNVILAGVLNWFLTLVNWLCGGDLINTFWLCSSLS